jgi:hypothetical protein
VSLNNLPKFTTLSYVWRDSNARESVGIEGHTLQITSSLANALRGVYRQFTTNPLDNSAEQWLWADGICINQADDHEKNHQVPLMREIYSKCTRMFSWLGAEEEGAWKFLDAINFVSSKISQIPGYELFMSQLDHHGGTSDHAMMEYYNRLEHGQGHDFADLTWLQKYYDNKPTFNSKRDAVFVNLHELFVLPYWER